MAALNAFTRAFSEVPPVTRSYMAASAATTIAVQLDIIHPLQLYFNPKLIFHSHQYWRPVTTFLYFGPLGISFMFSLTFTYRYCRMLEEDSFRNRTADFFYMFLVGWTLMCMLAYFVSIPFLAHPFTIMLVYIWSRRNPALRMNFFGFLTFRAPYLPWVLLAFTILLGSSTVVDIIGIIVGHFYYFFEDVFPNEPYGFRVLETPWLLKTIFNRLGIDEPLFRDEDRPEQFDFTAPRQEPPPEAAPLNQPDRPRGPPPAQTADIGPVGSESSHRTGAGTFNDETQRTTATTTEPLERPRTTTDNQSIERPDQELRSRNVTTQARSSGVES